MSFIGNLNYKIPPIVVFSLGHSILFLQPDKLQFNSISVIQQTWPWFNLNSSTLPYSMNDMHNEKWHKTLHNPFKIDHIKPQCISMHAAHQPEHCVLVFIHSVHYTELSVSLFLDHAHGLQQCKSIGYASILLTGRIYNVTAQINSSWTLEPTWQSLVYFFSSLTQYQLLPPENSHNLMLLTPLIQILRVFGPACAPHCSPFVCQCFILMLEPWGIKEKYVKTRAHTPTDWQVAQPIAARQWRGDTPTYH